MNQYAQTGGALALLVGGPMLTLGHLLSLGSDNDYGTVPGVALRVIAHTVLIFGFVAIYAVQSNKSGWLNHAGMTLSVVGTALVSAVVLIEVGGASGIEVAPLLESTFPALVVMVASMSFFIGVILFSSAIIRAGVLAKGSGLLLLIGNITFGIGTVAGPLEQVLIILGSAVTAAGLAWLGFTLLNLRTREVQFQPEIPLSDDSGRRVVAQT